MTPRQLIALLEDIRSSQRGAARQIGINERTMRKYVSGEASIPRTVTLALERLRVDHEHEALLGELADSRSALGAPFAQTHQKLRAIAEGRSRENPTLEEIRTASDAMGRFERARRRFEEFFERNRSTYVGEGMRASRTTR